MESINDRLRILISALDIRKTEFAQRINVSQPFISQLCSGSKVPSDRTIADICREFNVSEHWLRTGEGEMFAKVSRNREITSFVGDMLSGEPDFRNRLVSVLARLNVEQWKMLEEIADMLVEEMQKEKADQ